MKSGEHSLQPVFLRPGECFVSFKPSIVTTLLGSCVAVTMFSPRLRLAAICHALLADPSSSLPPDERERDVFKYVSTTIPSMLEKFRAHGLGPTEIEVKLFGGASVSNYGAGPGEWSAGGVGPANVRRARHLLEKAGLLVKRSHVGGDLGVKILFNTFNGDVLLKRLYRAALPPSKSHVPA